jgi:HSP20 family molecular chaperone IbpA
MNMRRSNEEEAPAGRAPFDWDDFQNRFFGEGGWKETWNGASGTIPWVDRYVKGILAEAVPDSAAANFKPSAAPSRQTAVACNVFETHRAVIVRVKLSGGPASRDVRVFGTAYELRLAGLPGGEARTIKLPVPVRLDGAKAICKEQILEVTLPKESESPVKEIPVRFMGDS